MLMCVHAKGVSYRDFQFPQVKKFEAQPKGGEANYESLPTARCIRLANAFTSGPEVFTGMGRSSCPATFYTTYPIFYLTTTRYLKSAFVRYNSWIVSYHFTSIPLIVRECKCLAHERRRFRFQLQKLKCDLQPDFSTIKHLN